MIRLSREKRKVNIKMPSGKKKSIEIQYNIKDIIGYDTSKIPIKESILQHYVGEKVLMQSGMLTRDSITGTIDTVMDDRIIIKINKQDAEWYGLLDTCDLTFQENDNFLSDLGIEAILK